MADGPVALGLAAEESEGDSMGAAAKSRQRLSAQFPERFCTLCMKPILAPQVTKPRRQHKSCSRFKSHLAAAVKAAGGIGFENADQARNARAMLLVAANALPTAWQRPRDECGRFRKVR